MDRAVLINIAYLAASVAFIVAFKLLARPRTAKTGNALAAAGMLLAIVATLADRQIVSFEVIVAGIVTGAAIGAFLALRVQMTAMPQMVALLNGYGGVASALVAGAALIETQPHAIAPWGQFVVATAISGLIGSLTLLGSLVAWAKLAGRGIPEKQILFPGQKALNALLGVVALALAAWLCADPMQTAAYWGLLGVAALLGVLLTIPIGGADMPVVICLLNSYSGLAACATGFVLDNTILIIAGSIVGASGLILCQIMSKAMNRSLANVLFGVMEGGTAASADDVYAGRIKSAAPEELALVFDHARKVVVVPGYGMAVAQAQHAVRDLMTLLESRGAEVDFAIHPVAGRMPGHMNVLLAEADIPYDRLRDLDQANPAFADTDVAVVIGANDVVNPSARTQKDSPIAGMPILEVDKARTVIVVKRSLSPGFAGIPNPLFAADNTLMYFADGKKAIVDLITAIKES